MRPISAPRDRAGGQIRKPEDSFAKKQHGLVWGRGWAICVRGPLPLLAIGGWPSDSHSSRAPHSLLTLRLSPSLPTLPAPISNSTSRLCIHRALPCIAVAAVTLLCPTAAGLPTYRASPESPRRRPLRAETRRRPSTNPPLRCALHLIPHLLFNTIFAPQKWSGNGLCRNGTTRSSSLSTLRLVSPRRASPPSRKQC